MKAAYDYTYRWDPGLVTAEDGLKTCVLASREDQETMVALLCDACEVPEPALQWKHRRFGGGCYNQSRACIRLSPAHTTEATVCHEVAHHVHCARDWYGSGRDWHGEGFCKVFREVLEAWGVEVPARAAYTPPRFTRRFAAGLVAKVKGVYSDDVKVTNIRGQDTWRLVYATIKGGTHPQCFAFTRRKRDCYQRWESAD